jgi:hypothetical protein
MIDLDRQHSAIRHAAGEFDQVGRVRGRMHRRRWPRSQDQRPSVFALADQRSTVSNWAMCAAA